MTGTLHGVLIYRIQYHLKERGYTVPYDAMSYALSEALMFMDKEVGEGDYISLPSGRTFQAGSKIKSKEGQGL